MIIIGVTKHNSKGTTIKDVRNEDQSVKTIELKNSSYSLVEFLSILFDKDVEFFSNITPKKGVELIIEDNETFIKKVNYFKNDFISKFNNEKIFEEDFSGKLGTVLVQKIADIVYNSSKTRYAKAYPLRGSYFAKSYWFRNHLEKDLSKVFEKQLNTLVENISNITEKKAKLIVCIT